MKAMEVVLEEIGAPLRVSNPPGLPKPGQGSHEEAIAVEELRRQGPQAVTLHPSTKCMLYLKYHLFGVFHVPLVPLELLTLQQKISSLNRATGRD